MVVLVTGANGQLGQAIASIAKNYPALDFVFCTSSDLDITDTASCEAAFEKHQPQFCINAAAYTAVDKAESEPEKAALVNVTGAQNVAQACKNRKATLLHVSTDFVFDGEKENPYTEKDFPKPTGVYGQTKLEGEHVVQAILDHYFIVRTSWVYSQFGNNFMKTMLRLASERDSLSVVDDQIGTPTHAVDLAEALIQIILSNKEMYGIYNFSNEGQCSWFDFAKEIFRVNNITITLQPIPTTSYPTPARRPKFSVLDKRKIKEVFGLQVKNWEESLKVYST